MIAVIDFCCGRTRCTVRQFAINCPCMTQAPADAGYDSRVRASFSRQRIMQLLGAALARVEPGAVDITLPYREDLTQQTGADKRNRLCRFRLVQS